MAWMRRGGEKHEFADTNHIVWHLNRIYIDVKIIIDNQFDDYNVAHTQSSIICPIEALHLTRYNHE